MTSPVPITSRISLIQPGDSADSRDNLQELHIEFLSEGGHYIVMRTERWAMDPGELRALADRLDQMCADGDAGEKTWR